MSKKNENETPSQVAQDEATNAAALASPDGTAPFIPEYITEVTRETLAKMVGFDPEYVTDDDVELINFMLARYSKGKWTEQDVARKWKSTCGKDASERRDADRPKHRKNYFGAFITQGGRRVENTFLRAREVVVTVNGEKFEAVRQADCYLNIKWDVALVDGDPEDPDAKRTPFALVVFNEDANDKEGALEVTFKDED